MSAKAAAGASLSAKRFLPATEGWSLFEDHRVAVNLDRGELAEEALTEQRLGTVVEYDCSNVAVARCPQGDAIQPGDLAMDLAAGAFADDFGHCDRRRYACAPGIVPGQSDHACSGVDEEVNRLPVDLGVGVKMSVPLPLELSSLEEVRWARVRSSALRLLMRCEPPDGRFATHDMIAPNRKT
jgi:hypothetical protein